MSVTMDITIVTMAATARMIEKMILIVFDICLVLLGFDTPILGRSRPALKDTKRAKALFFKWDAGCHIVAKMYKISMFSDGHTKDT